MQRGLGTQLRHLIDLLDGAVAGAYAHAGLRYRPRYTPVVRALMDKQPCTITEIAEAARITQPAATQTVALMLRDGLVSSGTSEKDARRREIRLTREAQTLVPILQRCWQATAAAANRLDAELPYPLSQLLSEATAALERQPFAERLLAAHADLPQSEPSPVAQAPQPNQRTTRTRRSQHP